MKRNLEKILPTALWIWTFSFISTWEVCKFSVLSRFFKKLSHEPQLWQPYLRSEAHKNFSAEAKRRHIAKGHLCDEVVGRKPSTIFCRVMNGMPSGTFNDTILHLPTLPGIYLSVELQGYLINGLINIYAIDEISYSLRRKLEQLEIRAFIASGYLTIAQVRSLNPCLEALITNRYIQGYVISQQLFLPFVLKVSSYLYDYSFEHIDLFYARCEGELSYNAWDSWDTTGPWVKQICLTFDCVIVRSGIAIGIFSAKQALFFNWEIRKFLENFNKAQEISYQQITEIIALSKRIRTNLKKANQHEKIMGGKARDWKLSSSIWKESKSKGPSLSDPYNFVR